MVLYSWRRGRGVRSPRAAADIPADMPARGRTVSWRVWHYDPRAYREWPWMVLAEWLPEEEAVSLARKLSSSARAAGVTAVDLFLALPHGWADPYGHGEARPDG
jgi:hypothetical protein